MKNNDLFILKKMFLIIMICSSSETSYAVTAISFGAQCSSAAILRSHGIRTAAYPFDWMVSSFDALYQALEDDFAHFLETQSLRVKDDQSAILDYYNFEYVHDFPTIKNETTFTDLDSHNVIVGGVMRNDWRDFIPLVQEKFRRRIERLRALLTSSEKIYFLRHNDTTKEQAIKLINLLEHKYPKLDFTLIAIGGTDDMKDDWQLDRVKVCYLPNIFDMEKWDKIVTSLNIEPIQLHKGFSNHFICDCCFRK